MDKKKNLLSKITIAFFCIIMLGIACYSFIKGEPPYTISDGMIYIFLIIVVLLISESFESLSIGNMITLKKEVKEKEKEVTKLSSENRELRNQVLSVVSTSLNNKNQSTAFIGFDSSFAKLFRVEPATEKESENKENIEDEILNPQDNTDKQARQSHLNRSKLMRETEKLALTKFIEKTDMKSCTFQKDVKFSEQFIGTDPIMERNIIFDAYIRRPLDEVFIEVRYNSQNLQMDFRLYYMISKIYHYSRVNQVQAKMIFLVPKLPPAYHDEYFANSMMNRNPEKNMERFVECFLPAIKSGLLEIKEMEITEDEVRAIESELKI